MGRDAKQVPQEDGGVQMSYPQEFINELSEDEDKLRELLLRQKYKRCLDKAKWCDERIARYTLQQDIQGISWQKEIKFYRRLKAKYIEISKQFKEAAK